MNQGGKRPLIGLTTRCRQREGRCTLAAEYLDAVVRAGGVPVILPPLGLSSNELASTLDVLDGLVLTGGGDIDPACYGKIPHPQNYDIDPQRDAFELALARWASETRLPIFGICRGMQVMNVALGGTLIAHLPEAVGETVEHRAPNCRPTEHSIRVSAESILASMLGILKCDTDLTAASWHHQAVDCLADSLSVVARAPDATIEAVEMRDHPFFLGVQWHPELTAAHTPLQQQLFNSLVATAHLSKSSRAAPQRLRVVG
ncbi:MAG: gamma-glutamyl-gamma-aminobutyrate hydrolase family protein [Gammaproteobacteria bacterium]